MIVNLPWINPINTNRIPNNFDLLVKESFSKFTEGTSKEYRFADKLLYIDNLRKYYLRTNDICSSVKDLISKRVMYELEEFKEMPSEEEILDVEFMEHCYEEGFRPFYSHEWDKHSSSRNEKVLKLILRIIQIVVEFED